MDPKSLKDSLKYERDFIWKIDEADLLKFPFVRETLLHASFAFGRVSYPTTKVGCCLGWAGWKRLQNRGRFAPPTSSSEASDELNDLMSPCNGFIRDCCQKEQGASVEADVLFNAWCAWCKDEKHDPGSKQLFWRDIRNALGIYRTESKRVKEDDGNGEEKRQRFYPGVRLTLAAREQAARFMAQKEEKERTARTSAYQPKDQNHQKSR